MRTQKFKSNKTQWKHILSEAASPAPAWGAMDETTGEKQKAEKLQLTFFDKHPSAQGLRTKLPDTKVLDNGPTTVGLRPPLGLGSSDELCTFSGAPMASETFVKLPQLTEQTIANFIGQPEPCSSGFAKTKSIGMGGKSSKFLYKPWNCPVQVTCLNDKDDIRGWERAGHHPNWDSLFFMRTTRYNLSLYNVRLAVHTSMEKATALSTILATLPPSSRWDCVLQLASSLAILHHRGVLLQGVSLDRAVCAEIGRGKWIFRWIDMQKSSVFEEPTKVNDEVRKFGEMAFTILGSDVDCAAEGVKEDVLEVLFQCVKLRKYEARQSDLLQKVCESFSTASGFWKKMLNHYEAASFYWSGLCATAIGEKFTAGEYFKQAIVLNPFSASARIGQFMMKENQDQTISLIKGPRTWISVSAQQRAGISPSTLAGIALTLLRAGWIAEAWWHSLQSLRELGVWEAGWHHFDENVLGDLGLSSLCKSSAQWHNLAYCNARKVLIQIQKKTSQVLRSSRAFSLLPVLSGIIPYRCTCPVADLFNLGKAELFKREGPKANNFPLVGSPEELLLWYLSRKLGKQQHKTVPDVLAWMRTPAAEDPNSVTVQVVQPAGLLIYFKRVNEELPKKDRAKQSLAIFLEHRIDTWNTYVLCANDLHSGHDLLHATVIPAMGRYPATLILVYSNNHIDKCKLKSHMKQPRKLNGLHINWAKSTSVENLLADAGCIDGKVSGSSHATKTFGMSQDAPADADLSTSAGARVLECCALPNATHRFLLFIRLEARNFRLLKVGFRGDKQEAEFRNVQFKVLESHTLATSRFPQKLASECGPKTLNAKRRLEMNLKCVRNLVHLRGSQRSSTNIDQPKSFRYVIVGGGTAAGYACREFVKRCVPKGEVLLISTEAYAPYERTTISKGFLLEQTDYPEFCTCAAEGDRKDESWYHENGITLFLSTTVLECDFRRGRLLTDTQGTVLYEHCLLCTGACPLELDIPGSFLRGIHYIRNISDGQGVIEASKSCPGGSVAIIGGGFLGVEAAAAMIDRGHKVTMIYRGEHLMTRLWSASVASYYEAYFEAKGARLLKNNIVTELESDLSGKQVCRLRLSGGTNMHVDFVICCLGATIPRGLYEEKLEFQGRGVKVNSHFQTSVSNVYAVGDMCSFPVKVYNRPEVMEHVEHARRSAEHAVKHMTRMKDLPEYDYRPFFYSRFFNLSWVLYGDPNGIQYLGCNPEGDNIPGQKLKLCTVWTTGSGVIRGIMLESASAKETKLAERLVAEKCSVPIALLASADSYDEFISILSEEAQPLQDKEDWKPCALSKTEISKLLQRLPIHEYTYVGSPEFREACNTVFLDWTFGGVCDLQGNDLLGALKNLNIEESKARFLQGFLRTSLSDINQLYDCLLKFGGVSAMELSVPKEEFSAFVCFALAHFIWEGMNTRTQKKKSAFNRVSLQIQADESLEVQSGLETIPDSAAVFFFPHQWEAVLCLERQLLWWQLPEGSHTDELLKEDGEIAIYCGRNLPFTVSVWRQCRKHLVALTTQPWYLAVLDSSLGEIHRYIALDMPGMSPAMCCGLSVSNDLIAVSLGGCGRLWSMECEPEEDSPLAEQLHNAISLGTHPVGRVKASSSNSRNGWHLVPTFGPELQWQPPAMAVFETACWCADQCLVLQDFTIWSTGKSIHASFYQEQMSTPEMAFSDPALEQAWHIEPMTSASHLSELWSSMHATLDYFDRVLKIYNNEDPKHSHGNGHSQNQRRYIHNHSEYSIGKALECCNRLVGPLRLAFHHRLQRLSAELSEQSSAVKQLSCHHQLQCHSHSNSTPPAAPKEEAEYQRQYSRQLGNMLFLSEGQSTAPITAAAVSTQGDSLLLVLRKERDWAMEFWSHTMESGQWSCSWSQVLPKHRSLESSPLCGLSGNGKNPVIAAEDLSIRKLEDGDVLKELRWTKTKKVNERQRSSTTTNLSQVNSDNLAVCLWISEDGELIVIQTIQEFFVWKSCKLVQSLPAAFLQVANPSSAPTEQSGAPATWTATGCHIDPSNNAYTLSAMTDSSWSFILRGETKFTKKAAYKLVRYNSNKVFKIWVNLHRVCFLTCGGLEVWQFPDSPKDVLWDEALQHNYLKAAEGSHPVGGVPEAMAVLEQSLFMASYQLPNNLLLEPVTFSLHSQALLGWDAACSTVLCFVLPRESGFGQTLVPKWALPVQVKQDTSVSVLLMTSHGAVVLTKGPTWSFWTIGTLRSKNRKRSSKFPSVVCSCGKIYCSCFKGYDQAFDIRLSDLVKKKNFKKSKTGAMTSELQQMKLRVEEEVAKLENEAASTIQSGFRKAKAEFKQPPVTQKGSQSMPSEFLSSEQSPTKCESTTGEGINIKGEGIKPCRRGGQKTLKHAETFTKTASMKEMRENVYKEKLKLDNLAASNIQKMYVAKNEYFKLKMQDACLTIQKSYRDHVETLKRKAEMEARIKAALMIQTAFRRRLARQKVIEAKQQKEKAQWLAQQEAKMRARKAFSRNVDVSLPGSINTPVLRHQDRSLSPDTGRSAGRSGDTKGFLFERPHSPTEDASLQTDAHLETNNSTQRDDPECDRSGVGKTTVRALQNRALRGRAGQLLASFRQLDPRGQASRPSTGAKDSREKYTVLSSSPERDLVQRTETVRAPENFVKYYNGRTKALFHRSKITQFEFSTF